jgi:hypothetical protein
LDLKNLQNNKFNNKMGGVCSTDKSVEVSKSKTDFKASLSNEDHQRRTMGQSSNLTNQIEGEVSKSTPNVRLKFWNLCKVVKF